MLRRFLDWIWLVDPDQVGEFSGDWHRHVNRSLSQRGWEDGPVWKFPLK